MSWALEGKPIHSVLVTRLRYLGDIVMSTVVLEVLRRGDSQVRLGYLCEEDHAPVLKAHPAINRLHSLRSKRTGSDARARTGQSVRADTARSYLGTITDLRRARYGLAVDLFFNPRSAWLLKLAGIPRRIGGTRKWRGRLYHHRVLAENVARTHPGFGQIAPGGLGEHLCRLAPLTHVETGLSFLDWFSTQFGPGELKPRLARPAVRPAVQTILNSLGIPAGQPFLLLAPGATWTSKEWPVERWEEFIGMILEGIDWPLAVLAPPGGHDRWACLAGRIPPDRGGMMPPLPLPDALAVTAAARALVTVDGGIMHAAVGFEIPTLALFGPTDPGIWFPYAGTGPFRVLARAPHCHPCDLHECTEFICLPELEPAVVWDALRDLLSDSLVQGREQP